MRANVLAACLLVAGGAMAVFASPSARAEPIAKVTVVIERVTAIETSEPNEDYFVEVWIGDSPMLGGEGLEIEDQNHIEPGWELSYDVDVADGPISVRVKLWDYDTLFRGGNDAIDITDDFSTWFLELDLTFSPCEFTNGLEGSALVAGECGQMVSTRGNGPVDAVIDGEKVEGTAEMDFRIEIDAPTAVDDLNIVCGTGGFSWPSSGTSFTITATALDASGQALLNVDALEIWTRENTHDGQHPTLVTNSASNAVWNVILTDVDGRDTFSYACKASTTNLSGELLEVSTGWRTVALRPDDPGEWPDVVPILYTGPPESRIDIVFVWDQTTYTGVTDPNFLGDVRNAIFGTPSLTTTGQPGFLSHPGYQAGQDRFNFWIARGAGIASDNCASDPWADRPHPLHPDFSKKVYHWADAVAILHRTTGIRDCAPGGGNFFSSLMNPPSTSLLLHETGHRPFGLADEYCGDVNAPSAAATCDGGYYQTRVLPNVFDSIAICSAAAAAEGVPDTCREWTPDFQWRYLLEGKFATFDPPTNDLMVDNQAFNLLDQRRIDYVFAECRSSRC